MLMAIFLLAEPVILTTFLQYICVAKLILVHFLFVDYFTRIMNSNTFIQHSLNGNTIPPLPLDAPPHARISIQ